MKKALLVLVISSLLALAAFAAPSDNLAMVESSDELYQTVQGIDAASLYAEFEGEGTEISPYVLSDAEQFNSFAALVNVTGSTYASSYVTLGGNIDFDGATLTPIGVKTSPFTGTFDGNGYTISNFSLPNVNYAGIVGCLCGGTVKNVGACDVNVSISAAGGVFVGAVVGYIDGTTASDGIVSDCFASGNISVTSTTGAAAVGGLVGKIMLDKGKAYVYDSSSCADVSGNGKTSCYVGGLVGSVASKSSCVFKLTGCFATGNASSTVQQYYSYSGGFAGYINQDESGWTDWYGELMADAVHIENCFGSGNATSVGGTTNSAGGFTGYITSYVKLANCYRNKAAVTSATSIVTSGSAVDKSSFSDKTFLSSTLLFDLANTWYVSSDGIPSSRALVKSKGTPETKNSASIRTSGKQGIRFGASVLTEMRDYTSEYGFIIALESSLSDKELTFDYGGKYVYGAAYNAAEGKDVIYDITDTGLVFTGVLVNIPESQYQTKVTARPYMKYTCDGETKVLYGESITRSIYEIALAAKNSPDFENLSEQEKTAINKIVFAVEG